VSTTQRNASARFAGKSVLVTGAGSGMGAATARLFAQEGARVTVVDLNSEAAAALAKEIGAGQPIVGDVSNASFCERAVESAVLRHGRLDVLVNAAGTIVRADALHTSDEEWLRVMNVNTGGTFFMGRSAVRRMKEQGSGAIINFGSIWGSVGGRGHVAYCASKGAVHQLTLAMALDHARDGIRINAVCPGEVDTPMLRSQRAVPVTDDDLQQMADRVVPMGRLAQPEEIARVVLFLASDDASYMTGALVPVDAGYTAI
jgi:NAD(P)-dependent dehydrogenase (short-subunit alcohol dehydrogenase family)